MENLTDRIQLLISTKGFTNAEFADKIGVQPSNISHIISGRNKPSLDLVTKILNGFKEIRTEWLLKGTGSMTRDYTLFEMEEEGAPQRVSSTVNASAKATPDVSSEKILKASGDKSFKNVQEKAGLEGDIPEKEGLKKMKVPDENTNPHKKQQKAIEKIVVFYEDNTFREYFPEN
jgi:transcriptional regulator with XRE-family HTH domain